MFYSRILNVFNRRSIVSSVFSLFFIINIASCQQLSSLLSNQEGVGVITGYVMTDNNIALEQVEVSILVKENLYSVFTNEDGKFRLSVPAAQRNEGYNLSFAKNNFNEANHAVIFETPNLRIDIDKFVMKVIGHEKAALRSIEGFLLDDFSENPLQGATIYIENALSTSVTAVSTVNGFFSVSDSFFVEGSTYVVSIYKDNYVPRSNIVVGITGIRNYINNKVPVRLYKKYGKITGRVVDENGTPLSGASVRTVDSLKVGNSSVTSSDGVFSFSSEYLYLGTIYSLEVAKTNYQTKSYSVQVEITGANNVGDLAIVPDVSITGIVTQSGTSTPLANVSISIMNFSHGTLETTTNASGMYTLNHSNLTTGATYNLLVMKNGYGVQRNVSTGVLAVGPNTKNISLVSLPTASNAITGIIRSYYFGEEIPSVNVYVVDADDALRGYTTDEDGHFIINGNFRVGQSYKLSFSKNLVASGINYTGNGLGTNIYESSFSFVYNGSGATPYDLTPIYRSDLVLYPIGIFIKDVQDNVIRKSFTYSIKQTFEEFLDNRVGLVISAREQPIDIKVKDLGGTGDDSNTFYIYMANKDYPLNAINAGYAYTTVPVNGPPVNVTQYERLETDTRAAAYDIRSYSLLRFFISNPSYVTISTDSTYLDTYISLYKDNVLVTEDDDSGELFNAKIRRNLPKGWYIIKVKSKYDTAWGDYNVKVTADTPQIAFFNQALPINFTTTSETGDVILSYYNKNRHIVYISGVGEVGSSSSLTLEKFGTRDQIIRGSFYGSLIAISENKSIFNIGSSTQDQGFFNIIRQE